MWFYVKNHDMSMKDAVVEISGIFDHLVFCNVPWHCEVRGHLPFRIYLNATTAAAIELATFGSAVEHPSHWSLGGCEMRTG